MSADPTQSLLLALASGDDSAASKALAGLIDPDDPIAPVLSQLMSARAGSGAGTDGLPEWPAPPEPAFPVAELEQLRRRNDQLAAALGACYLCWGEDGECPICNGSGSPGAAPSHTRFFAFYVLPALNRLRRRPERRAQLVHDATIEQGR